jgi:hypothetical protein
MLEQMPKENFRMAEAKWPVCQEEAQTGRCEGPLRSALRERVDAPSELRR